MSETNSKQHSDNEIIEQHVSPILSDAIKGRAKQSILDAVQYVEVLGSYGRGGHLQDMTIYALFQALKQVTTLNSQLASQVWELTDTHNKLGAISGVVEELEASSVSMSLPFIKFYEKIKAILEGEKPE